MVEKCIECKYFNDDPDSIFGKCSLHYGYKNKNHTCDDFTNKAEYRNNHYAYKIHDLEMRIEKLEKNNMEVFIGRVKESKKILGSFSFLKGGINYGGFYSMCACYYVCIRGYICS